MIGLSASGVWSLATGLTVKEPEHCKCGERHGFKEVRMGKYKYQLIHTPLPQVVSYAARRAAPMHFTPAPTSGTASPPPHKRCTCKSIKPLANKASGSSKNEHFLLNICSFRIKSISLQQIIASRVAIFAHQPANYRRQRW